MIKCSTFYLVITNIINSENRFYYLREQNVLHYLQFIS